MKKLSFIFFLFFISAHAVLPTFVFAHDLGLPGGLSTENDGVADLCPDGKTEVPKHADSKIIHASLCNKSTSFENPLGKTSTIDAVIAAIITQLYIIAIPISSIFILYGAFLMLTSQGEMEKIRQGKKTITYAIVGLIIMFALSGIGYIIRDILTIP